LISSTAWWLPKDEEVGIPAPTHAALTEVVKRVERGESEAHPQNVEKL